MSSVRMTVWAMVGATTLTALPMAAHAETAPHSVVLVPHRAVYDLRLKNVRNPRAVESMSGRILYDFNGSACEGYTLVVRQASAMDAGEGRSQVADQTMSTFEDGQGDTLHFAARNRRNDEDAEQTDGNASRKGKDVVVTLTQPEAKTFDAGADIVFPTEQMRRVIAAARDGRAVLQMPLYDGSDNGLKVLDTTAIIGKVIPPGGQAVSDAAAGKAELAGLRRWPVTISFFDRSNNEGDKTMSYSISFELYENGISRDLSIDYKDFVLAGDLTSLDIKPTPACK